MAVKVTAMIADAAVSPSVSRDETVTSVPYASCPFVSDSNRCSKVSASSNIDSGYTDFHTYWYLTTVIYTHC